MLSALFERAVTVLLLLLHMANGGFSTSCANGFQSAFLKGSRCWQLIYMSCHRRRCRPHRSLPPLAPTFFTHAKTMHTWFIIFTFTSNLNQNYWNNWHHCSLLYEIIYSTFTEQQTTTSSQRVWNSKQHFPSFFSNMWWNHEAKKMTCVCFFVLVQMETISSTSIWYKN